MALVAPRHVASSRTRARTCVPCTGRQILNHCATKEALCYHFCRMSPQSGITGSEGMYTFNGSSCCFIPFPESCISSHSHQQCVMGSHPNTISLQLLFLCSCPVVKLQTAPRAGALLSSVQVKWSANLPTISWTNSAEPFTGRRTSSPWATRTCCCGAACCETPSGASGWSSLQVSLLGPKERRVRVAAFTLPQECGRRLSGPWIQASHPASVSLPPWCPVVWGPGQKPRGRFVIWLSQPFAFLSRSWH